MYVAMYIFLERGKRKKRARNSWGPGPQPRQVPWPGIQLATFLSHTSQGPLFSTTRGCWVGVLTGWGQGYGKIHAPSPHAPALTEPPGGAESRRCSLSPEPGGLRGGWQEGVWSGGAVPGGLGPAIPSVPWSDLAPGLGLSGPAHAHLCLPLHTLHLQHMAMLTCFHPWGPPCPLH